ncbi:uncharacterized protein P7C73_g840, partial [Tremellales sp. Uapishka_1]
MSLSKFLWKAHYVPLALIGTYALLLAALTFPSIQREFIFLNAIKVPFFTKYSNPERYGLAPFKTRNFNLTTPDGETIGVWHVLPRSYYRNLVPFPPESLLPEEIFVQALQHRPTIIYLHGNVSFGLSFSPMASLIAQAGTRAASHRVRGYNAFSSQLDCNVLAVDYRGFGDSTGEPSEDGLVIDARTVWDHVLAGVGHKRADEEIILVGQSLGTGVVAALAGRLADLGQFPRALVMIAPFTSLPDLLATYQLFFLIPVLSPLQKIPGALTFFTSFLKSRFNSTQALLKTSSPTLFVHALNDPTIPPSHSATLFSSLRTGDTQVDVTKHAGWGSISSYGRKDKGEVIWWEGDTGGHNGLGWSEGVIDLIARVGAL